MSNKSKTIQSIFIGFTIISIILLPQNQAEGTDHFIVNFQYADPWYPICDYEGACKIIGQTPYVVEGEEVHGKIWSHSHPSYSVVSEFTVIPDGSGNFTTPSIFAHNVYEGWYVSIEYNGEYAISGPDYSSCDIVLDEKILIYIPTPPLVAFFTGVIEKTDYSNGDELIFTLYLDTVEAGKIIPITITNNLDFSWSTSVTVPSETGGAIEKIIELDELGLDTGSYKITGKYFGYEYIRLFDFTKEDEFEQPDFELGKVEPNPIEIDPWIKNIARWWANNEIPDSDFVSGIQFLVNEGILEIPPTSIVCIESGEIQFWVKENAGWWAAGKVTDSHFVSILQRLIKIGILKI